MDISALSANPSVRAAMAAAQSANLSMPGAAQLAADREALGLGGGKDGAASQGQPTPADIKKAATQFEAIILRQLLEPSMAPLMSGGMGGGESGGGGMYGYMLTDVLATSLSQGGGLGWAKLLEKQLSPSTPRVDISNTISTS